MHSLIPVIFLEITHDTWWGYNCGNTVNFLILKWHPTGYIYFYICTQYIFNIILSLDGICLQTSLLIAPRSIDTNLVTKKGFERLAKTSLLVLLKSWCISPFKTYSGSQKIGAYFINKCTIFLVHTFFGACIQSFKSHRIPKKIKWNPQTQFFTHFTDTNCNVP